MNKKYIKLGLENTFYFWWLRSIYSGDSNGVGCVGGLGGVHYDYANINYDVLLACFEI